ncbi:MAG: cobyrinate a,c-diamide synthase [Alphaproteobacteria bacterium]|nr:cobyrinate a,c-diamide synthase [Alphaproteobacteria bacterium]
MAGRGLLIAAPRSGAGKTTVTMALAAALVRRGVGVRTAKAGPDYIDPGFHAAVTGAPCINLDSWAMPPALLDTLVADAAPDGTLLLVEAAMGLFDGVVAPRGRSGAAADLAARYRVPVLLVLDVTGQMQSAAAVAAGFAQYDPAVTIAGVVLNRVAGKRHREAVSEAVQRAGIAVLGALPRDAGIAMPERHLGLVQAAENARLPALIETLAEAAERHFDLDAILRTAAPLTPPPGPLPQGEGESGTRTTGFPPLAGEGRGEGSLAPPGQRIAMAADAAFSFVYPHMLQAWRRAGAEIVPFSPLADEPPAADCDACWLPGGYPELHAGRLAAGQKFRAGLARFAETRPVHGECGGYMVLGVGLEDAEGQRHAMCGLLGHSSSFSARRLHLGYREARLAAGCVLGRAGRVIRGHEFHYARLTDPGRDAPLADFADAAGHVLGPGGGRRGHVTGAFFHAIAAI